MAAIFGRFHRDPREIQVNRTQMAVLQHLMKTHTILRAARSTILNHLLGTGVYVSMSHPVIKTKCETCDKTRQKWQRTIYGTTDKGRIDRESDMWSDFLTDYWTSIWQWGFAICALSANNANGDRPYPVVITDITDLDISFIATESERESRWIVRRRPSLRESLTGNPTTQGAKPLPAHGSGKDVDVLENIRVFVHDRPSREGSIHSNVASVLMAMQPLQAAMTAQIAASLIQCNPVMMLQHRPSKFEDSLVTRMIDPRDMSSATIDEIYTGQQDLIERLNSFAVVNAQKYKQQEPTETSEDASENVIDILSRSTSAFTDASRVMFQRSTTIPRDMEYKAPAQAREPGNLADVYRIFTGAVASVFGIPASAFTSVGSSQSTVAHDEQARAMLRRTIVETSKSSKAAVRVMWKLINVDRVVSMFSLFGDVPKDQLEAAACDLEVRIQGEPPIEEAKIAWEQGLLKTDAFQKRLSQALGITMDEMEPPEKVKRPIDIEREALLMKSKQTKT